MVLSRKWLLAASGIVTLGAVLRILAAQGDLWVDEITTLMMVGRMHNPLQVFVLAHDNNHFLNSLYLYFIGPDATPLVQRTFSIVLGVATIIAAGICLSPAGRGAALLAMLLFAVSFPMISYDSEARGYSGLILCTVLAIHYLDKELRQGGQRWKLAITIFFGLLFHLTMAGVIFAVGLLTFIDSYKKLRILKSALINTFQILWPSMLLASLVAIDLTVAVIVTHKIEFGSVTKFSSSNFMFGYCSLVMATLGMPDRYGLVVGLVIVAISFLTFFSWHKPDNKRTSIYFFLLVIWPAILFIGHVPNTIISRYFLTSAVAFLLLLTDLAALAWGKGTICRAVVLVALAVLLFLNIASFRHFLIYGRGQYATTVATMTSKGPTTYGGMNNDFINLADVQFYAKRQNVQARYVPDSEFCTTQPEWLINHKRLSESLPGEHVVWGPESCPLTFDRVAVFPAWGMSGLSVTLYRRVK